MKLSELYWSRITPLHFVLWPCSIVYQCFLSLKKLCYWLEIFPAIKLPVPVIAVNSLSINDDNSPSLIEWIVNILLRNGYTPGIVTHSKSDYSGSPRAITTLSSLDAIDGQTLVLAQHCGAACPVWIGRNPIDVAQALLSAHPHCNIIILNGGLTDFRFERDINIVIADLSPQSFGNGLLLPAGPLRMNIRQLSASSIFVTSGNSNFPHLKVHSEHWPEKIYTMKLITDMTYNVLQPTRRQPISEFNNKNLHAVASDDHASWFLEFIDRFGINAQLHDYREHHLFKSNEIDFPETDAVLMPEENALQCKEFAHDKLWAVPRNAWINEELQTALIRKLRQLHTTQ